MANNNWLLESLGTMQNILDTVVILGNIGKENLILTQLELLYIEASQLVDDFCIEHACPVGHVE